MNLERTDGLCVKSFILGPLQTNCYLVYDTSVMTGLVIDPGWQDPSLLSEIESLGVSVINVINTHGHADHIAGNSGFKAPILVHELDADFLVDPEKNLSKFSGTATLSPPASGTLREGDILSVGNLELQILHTPGHTPGGICLKVRDLLFSGDTLFYQGIGRTDLPGGDFKLLLRNIETKLFVLDERVRVFPGHGPETTIGEAKRYINREFSYI